MTMKERYEKYVKENCSQCTNKENFECEIRVCKQGDIITTKCSYYKRLPVEQNT